MDQLQIPVLRQAKRSQISHLLNIEEGPCTWPHKIGLQTQMQERCSVNC